MNLPRGPWTVEEKEETTRLLLLIAAAFIAFGATLTFESTDAGAVVCARGLYRRLRRSRRRGRRASMCGAATKPVPRDICCSAERRPALVSSKL